MLEPPWKRKHENQTPERQEQTHTRTGEGREEFEVLLNRFRARTMKNTSKVSWVIVSQFLRAFHLRHRNISDWLKSPETGILELKITKDERLLYLTVESPLLRGAFKGFKFK